MVKALYFMKKVFKNYFVEKPTQAIIIPNKNEKIYNTFSSTPIKCESKEEARMFYKGSDYMSFD